jgi:predicted enzyme related to lactoylglutathione lyase
MAKPAVAWFEVTGKNAQALQRFYSTLFDWNIQDVGQGYGVVTAAEYLKKAEELGGRTVLPVTELADFDLTFAMFTDPEGHLVGLSKGTTQWGQP